MLPQSTIARRTLFMGFLAPRDRGLPALERRHHVFREPAKLLSELARREAFGPVHHEVLEAGILRLDRLDAGDDVRGRLAEPRLLRDAVGEGRHARGRAGRAPRAPLLV